MVKKCNSKGRNVDTNKTNAMYLYKNNVLFLVR